MSESKKYELLKLGTRLKSGRLYSTKTVENAIERLKGQNLRGQFGFPRRHLVGETAQEFHDRSRRIDEELVSHEISNLHIEGMSLVGDVTPSGPYHTLLEKTPEHYAFGLRSFSTMAPGSYIVRDLQIITFDLIPNWEQS